MERGGSRRESGTRSQCQPSASLLRRLLSRTSQLFSNVKPIMKSLQVQKGTQFAGKRKLGHKRVYRFTGTSLKVLEIQATTSAKSVLGVSGVFFSVSPVSGWVSE